MSIPQVLQGAREVREIELARKAKTSAYSSGAVVTLEATFDDSSAVIKCVSVENLPFSDSAPFVLVMPFGRATGLKRPTGSESADLRNIAG